MESVDAERGCEALRSFTAAARIQAAMFLAGSSRSRLWSIAATGGAATIMKIGTLRTTTSARCAQPASKIA